MSHNSQTGNIILRFDRQISVSSSSTWIVAVRDPIRLADAKQRGLDPIILYGVTVAGSPIRWLTLSAMDPRKSLKEVLLTAWKFAEGLGGFPDILRVNRYEAQADPALAVDLAKIGTGLEIADPNDKTVPASLRSAQDASVWLLNKHEPADMSLAESVESLCRDAHSDHDWRASRSPRGLSIKGRRGCLGRTAITFWGNSRTL